MRRNLRLLALVAVASLSLHALCAKTEYMVIETQGVSGTKKITKEVNEKLAEGWKCQGGVSFFQGVYRQAMVRETN